MPTYLPEGFRVPAGDDPYDLTNDLRRMMESATTIVPVTNTAARDALVAALGAAGRPPSADRPVYVSRADATPGVQTEFSTDGTNWKSLAATDDTGWITSAPSANWSVVGGLSVQYRRRNGIVYLRGAISRASGTNNVITLPDGFRPSGQNPVFPIAQATSASSAPAARVTVGVDGLVVQQPLDSGAVLYLNSVQFPTG